MVRARVISGLTMILLAAAATPATPDRPLLAVESPRYPPTERGLTADDWHGTRVADPYRWLETPGPAVSGWVQAQNALSQPWLENIPARQPILNRLTELWDYDQYGYPWMDAKLRVPLRRGGRYFFVVKAGRQNQGVLYWTTDPDASPRVLVDPNALSADGTVSLADFSVSPDGRYVAWAVSDGGTDWDRWQIREVDTGRDLPDTIVDTKFTGVAWEPDGRAFYYSRYPQGAGGKGDDQQQVRVYRHVVGTPQADDALVYAITGHPRHNPYAQVSEDGRWLVFQVSYGFSSNAIHLRDLRQPAAPVQRVFDAWDGLYEFLGALDGRLYFKTTQGAARGRVIAIRPGAGEVPPASEVIPEQPATLVQASLVGGHVIASYLEDARARLRVYRLDGSLRGEIALPGAGTVTGFPDAPDGTETFFAYTDYLTPAALYRYDIARDELRLFRQPRIPFDAAPFTTVQVFYTSRDGTRVPMFITHRRGIALDGSHPLLLYGYGGFDVALTPEYTPAVAAWLERGGIYAVANLRGGGEYGAEWHEAGTTTRKQNVFDDFIAAAAWIVANHYTVPQKLAIHGRSNGGLLVGAVLTQRPELFGAALPAVGVLDLLRYHTASANAYAWSSDYGTAEDAAQFGALYAYSPVHNARPGRCYPPTLITTADHDDRVVPWHSFKFAAALQYAQACPHPVLLRVETRAGHGAGKPTRMQIEDVANRWAFLVRALGMPGGR